MERLKSLEDQLRWTEEQVQKIKTILKKSQSTTNKGLIDGAYQLALAQYLKNELEAGKELAELKANLGPAQTYNFKVLEAHAISEKPVSPVFLKTLILSVLAAILIVFGWIFFRETCRST